MLFFDSRQHNISDKLDEQLLPMDGEANGSGSRRSSYGAAEEDQHHGVCNLMPEDSPVKQPLPTVKHKPPKLVILKDEVTNEDSIQQISYGTFPDDQVIPTEEFETRSRPASLGSLASSLGNDKLAANGNWADGGITEEGDGGVGESHRRIPFTNIHEKIYPFSEKSRSVYIPDTKISVKVVDTMRLTTSQFTLNPNLYYVEVRHGEFTWTVKHKFNHFRRLHEEILLYKAQLNVPIPTQRHIERRKSYKINRSTKDLAHFPRTLDGLITSTQMPKRMQVLERYLQGLVKNPLYRNHPKTLEFLEISHLSFVNDLGPKGKEGWVEKRSGGHHVAQGCCGCLSCCVEWCTAHYNKRWFIAKDSFVSYVNPDDGHMRSVLLMDKHFVARSGQEHVGDARSLLVSNEFRDLVVRCSNRHIAREWMVQIMLMAESCEYTNKQRFNSFAPVRNETYASWFVDGEHYFESLADALEEAKEEIFISDWWFNPDIYLKRPIFHGHRWRIDNILQRKAEEGVKVCILLYKEVEMALGLCSKETKRRLQKLHKNIRVIRHPDHVPGGTILWAHHEKLVAIDQQVAYLGGLDICYGRWDDFKHRLVDLGSAFSQSHENPYAKKREIPGNGEVSNVTFTDVDGNRNDSLRIQSMKNSTLRTSVDERLDQMGIHGAPKLWPGKDYCNFIVRDVADPHDAFTDNVDRSKTPRMPWHDIAGSVTGKLAADVSRHFIQRWNASKLEKVKQKDAYMLLVPKSISQIKVKEHNKQQRTNCKCQLLRSIGSWSCGMKYTEDSIQRAYVHAIQTAEHYIYIENQFFISLIDDTEVTNQIASALYQRIVKAYREKATFRVYVVLPLLPAFQGEVGEDEGRSIHAILHWEYKSICKGECSLIERLKKEGIVNPQNYISFYGLRNHGNLNGTIVTELVYIHSKLMIVDDRLVILGSANINDRSLLGNRDSELAIIVEDTENVPSVMNGAEYQAGKFAYGLRQRLFKEHLGILLEKTDVDIRDPVSDHFYKGVWMNIAANNTQIYDQVFCCLPSDKCHTFEDLKAYKQEAGLSVTDVEEAKRLLEKVCGYLVLTPLQFLSNSNLNPTITTQEGIAPNKLWT
ncbi:phospholipase D1-like [Anneissia japonica]|uniref:phospholipase D1-like n=1 Tax=Anneissia japonica TaxID=1529436 RepID=UPI001425701B|nr:phospholipase D1-like [Anneissia japonica]